MSVVPVLAPGIYHFGSSVPAAADLVADQPGATLDYETVDEYTVLRDSRVDTTSRVLRATWHSNPAVPTMTLAVKKMLLTFLAKLIFKHKIKGLLVNG